MHKYKSITELNSKQITHFDSSSLYNSSPISKTFHQKYAKKKQVTRLNMEEIAKKSLHDFIPCLFMRYEPGSSKVFLYFHANAEDLGRAYKLLTYVHKYLQMHVIAMEYPGYGVYSD